MGRMKDYDIEQHEMAYDDLEEMVALVRETFGHSIGSAYGYPVFPEGLNVDVLAVLADEARRRNEPSDIGLNDEPGPGQINPF
ncbi:MAG: hypothetical protein ABEL51_04580 [Salinibacter sp.]